MKIAEFIFKALCIVVPLFVAIGCGSGEATLSTPKQSVNTPLLNVDETGNSQFDINQLELNLLDYPIDSLDAEEIAGLMLMREEEKLAHDVYLALLNLHGLTIFSNIAESEATHTAAMMVLLDRYSIEDPTEGNTIGEFTNATLQQLYDDLVYAGTPSLVDALTVGAQVEELDIRDIRQLVEALNENDDIAMVYDNLLKGSRNHLRSFYSQLIERGGSYTPQYISQELFDDIISSPIERGN